MTRSAFSAAIAPIIGRLPAIAVAAAAEHHDQPAGRIGPQRLERLGERVGLVGVVDEDRRAVASRRRVRAGPWRPCSASSAANTAARLAAGRDRKPGGDQRVLDLEGADQRQPHGVVGAGMRELQHLREAVDRGCRRAGCPRRAGRP